MHFVIEVCFIKPKQRKNSRLLCYIESMKIFSCTWSAADTVTCTALNRLAVLQHKALVGHIYMTASITEFLVNISVAFSE
jgi:hypothetical protein